MPARLQNNPWAQSAAYQASLVSDVRNPAALTLVGRGDPTGRGRGFAFVRDDPKRAKEEAAPPPGVQAAADGTITGGLLYELFWFCLASKQAHLCVGFVALLLAWMCVSQSQQRCVPDEAAGSAYIGVQIGAGAGFE